MESLPVSCSPQHTGQTTLTELKRMMDSNPTLHHPVIENLGFLFEESKAYFDVKDGSHQLTNAGPFHLARLKEMKAIHLLLPSKFQSYHVKSAVDPHGQVLFVEFVEGLLSLPPEHLPMIFLYEGNKDYKNDFIVVRNDCTIAHSVDWDFVHRAVPNSASRDPGVQRQASFIDFGHCTWLSSSRVGGRAEPNLKPGSNQPEVVSLTETLSDLLCKSSPPWRQGHVQLPSLNSIRLSRTSPAHRCKLHRDNRSNSTRVPDVVCVSSLWHGVRLAVNGQMKKSMEQLQEREEETKDLLGDLLMHYQNLPEERRLIGPALLHGPIQNVCGFPCIRNLCNLDATAYSQPLFYSVARMAEHFNLNICELHSVHLASVFVPEAKIFFPLQLRS